jgi:hypothetical protein
MLGTISVPPPSLTAAGAWTPVSPPAPFVCCTPC